MPYRLRVTLEEVRQELAKMGFNGLSDDEVAAMHKDLLKMIKSDLRKLKHVGQDAGDIDTSEPCRPAKAKQQPHRRASGRSSTPTLKRTDTKETSYSSLSASHTSEDKDDSTGESGYSDIESTVSGLSETTSYSAASEIPQRQASTEGKHGMPKQVTTREQVKSEGSASGTHTETRGMPHVETTVPSKKPIRKTKTKKVGQDAGLPKYPSRPDPVRLYHYYKAHWDQYKVPGEDPRLKLRWDVRSKLFYGD